LPRSFRSCSSPRPPAHAGPLSLDFQGSTFVHFEGSPAGPPIANGTRFDVQADFDPTTGTILQQGVAAYAVTALVLIGGGTSYTATDPSDYFVTLVDDTNTVAPGFYYPLLDNNSGDTQFDELGPAYTAATTAFSATDPTPTVFSGYMGSQAFGNILELSTAAGPITRFSISTSASAPRSTPCLSRRRWPSAGSAARSAWWSPRGVAGGPLDHDGGTAGSACAWSLCTWSTPGAGPGAGRPAT
jgi:hypothetical protein